MSTQSAARWHRSLAENRQYHRGFEEGFERGTRAGISADRFYWFALGVVTGALLALLARAFI